MMILPKNTKSVLLYRGWALDYKTEYECRLNNGFSPTYGWGYDSYTIYSVNDMYVYLLFNRSDVVQR